MLKPDYTKSDNVFTGLTLKPHNPSDMAKFEGV